MKLRMAGGTYRQMVQSRRNGLAIAPGEAMPKLRATFSLVSRSFLVAEAAQRVGRDLPMPPTSAWSSRATAVAMQFQPFFALIDLYVIERAGAAVDGGAT